MTIPEILQQAQDLTSQLTLTLDNPKSVKLQLKQISLVQKQLRALKKELTAEIKAINQQATQTGADSILSVGLDVFGKRKWAGRVRAETRRAIERQKRGERQPYMEVKDLIDQLLLEGDRLKLEGEQYLIG
ncbi:hypothetical protein HJG54_27560 [Leptolyngbya sp. NK1-12]|uniref:Uncharacterized protein n=1 Tax=Leptolyngbya sp. NK1-12 TaxID=2547451 RepID=A0AA97AI39_9CYAN|nr:hypothetical protein [Leptolyngbya sp. NK1-12]WNZ26205.1 hypothetical protein HJG54_27560 [Leptolyngbya sp. NK1-12]